jgi:hypothetical protein
VERVVEDAVLARDGRLKGRQFLSEGAKRCLVVLDRTTVATARRSLKVADGTHVLLGLCQNDAEQVEKVLRGNAQTALSHVGLHDAQDSTGLASDKFDQVSAPKVTGHEKLEVGCQGTPDESPRTGVVAPAAPPAEAALLTMMQTVRVVVIVAAGIGRKPEAGPGLTVFLRAVAHGHLENGRSGRRNSSSLFLFLFKTGRTTTTLLSPKPRFGQRQGLAGSR